MIETREFKSQSHNDDLCPRLQHQLETVLNATGRFEPVVYDTQGFQDQGADIVIRIRHAHRLDHEPPELVGFQVKSFGDFRQKDLLRTLKAQRDDALRKIAGLSTYYILLCTDEQHDKNAIRNIESEFKAAEKTIIIEPTCALGFLRLSERRIEGIVKRLQHADDFVYREALETVALDTPTAGILAVYLAARECEGAGEITALSLPFQGRLETLYTAALQSRRSASERYKEEVEQEDDAGMRARIRLAQGPSERDIARVSENFFDDYASALAYDIDLLDTHLIDVEGASGRISVRRNELLPVIAHLTDAQARYQLEGNDLFLYGVETLGVAE